MRKSAPFLLFFLVSFSAMCYFLISGNDISIGFARERGVFNQVEGEYNDTYSLSERKDDRAGYVTIPLPDNLGEENVTVTRDFYSKEIKVTVSPVEQDFYHKNLFSGEMNRISSIKYGYEDGTAYILFDSDEIVEPVTELKSDKLFIKFVSPKEYYSHIVVIDPGHGGDDSGTTTYGIKEKDIINSVTEKLKTKLPGMLADENIGVYFTRNGDETLSEEDRENLVRTVSADLLISIHTAADSKSRTTNGSRALSVSADRSVAESFSRNVSEKCSMSYNGWVSGNDLSIFNNTGDVSVMVELGFITNRKEALLMNSDTFQDNAAEALAESIKEYFGNK